MRIWIQIWRLQSSFRRRTLATLPGNPLESSGPMAQQSQNLNSDCFTPTTWALPQFLHLYRKIMIVPVLVHSGSDNRNTIEWGAYKQQKFLTVLESKIRCWQTWCLVRARFLDGCLFTVTSHGRRVWLALQSLFHKDTNPTHQGSNLMS